MLNFKSIPGTFPFCLYPSNIIHLALLISYLVLYQDTFIKFLQNVKMMQKSGLIFTWWGHFTKWGEKRPSNVSHWYITIHEIGLGGNEDATLFCSQIETNHQHNWRQSSVVSFTTVVHSILWVWGCMRKISKFIVDNTQTYRVQGTVSL